MHKNPLSIHQHEEWGPLLVVKISYPTTLNVQRTDFTFLLPAKTLTCSCLKIKSENFLWLITVTLC